MLVEVTQLAKFLNGAFVRAWHFVGFLVNTATEALHEKTSGTVLFMYFVALAVLESVARMKEGKDPLNFVFTSSVFQHGHLPCL